MGEDRWSSGWMSTPTVMTLYDSLAASRLVSGRVGKTFCALPPDARLAMGIMVLPTGPRRNTTKDADTFGGPATLKLASTVQAYRDEERDIYLNRGCLDEVC
jgi:hypothetical protein